MTQCDLQPPGVTSYYAVHRFPHGRDTCRGTRPSRGCELGIVVDVLNFVLARLNTDPA